MGAPRRKGMAASVIATKTGEMLEADVKNMIADEMIQEELNRKQVIPVPIEDLYSAPASWNEWTRLPEEKIIQLCESIVEIGLQNPCVVWKIDKATVLSLYNPGEEDAYGFIGDKYMILSGHNRAFCTKLIGATVEHADDEEYQSIPCFIYEDKLSDDFIEKAKQIIDDTNFLSRDKTPKETMRAIQKKYQQFENGKRRQTENVAKQVAKTLNISEQQVFNYNKVAKNLIPEIQQVWFDSKISFNDAQKLSAYSLPVQEYLCQNNRTLFTNKRELKNFLKNTTSDMSIKEVQEELETVEKKVSFEKITVSVPADRVEEFHELFNKWKNKTLN